MVNTGSGSHYKVAKNMGLHFEDVIKSAAVMRLQQPRQYSSATASPRQSKGEQMEVTTVELTRDEIIRRLDAGARRRRGLSAYDLITLFRSGKLDEPCEVTDLLALADLLPDTDPLFAAAA